MSANVVVIDEAAFVKKQLFLNTIFPLLQEGATSMIALTTPGNDQAFINKIVQFVDENGDPYINFQSVGLMCDACKVDKKYGMNCQHMPWVLPDNISTRGRDKVKKFYEFDHARGLKELMGIVSDDEGHVFSPTDINYLLSNESIVSISRPAKVAFLFQDPSGGGRSRHALAAFVLTGEKRVVCYTRLTDRVGAVSPLCRSRHERRRTPPHPLRPRCRPALRPPLVHHHHHPLLPHSTVPAVARL